jgi:putative tryptophan/tyrosine transport system substrate-binding protein
VILTDTTPVTAAVLRETRTITIIFVQVSDPVGSGFVTSVPRPGGNATGFTTNPLTMASKWLELLMEVAPRTVRVMFLFNPPTTAHPREHCGRCVSASRELHRPHSPRGKAG